MPRVPKVFEEKTKWNLEFTEEEFQDTVPANYKSAEQSADDIERQVLEEVQGGSIDNYGSCSKEVRRAACSGRFRGSAQRDGIVGS